jgi:heme-degrading monooxygenase HmoA
MTPSPELLQPGAHLHADAEQSPSSRPLFVALSRFVVANAMSGAVREAFANRPHLVESAPGFVRLDVICPEDAPDEFWLITYWTDHASYEAWHHSALHHASHAGIPKGLKLVRGSAHVRFFTHVAS